jgi:hypothetical protein
MLPHEMRRKNREYALDHILEELEKNMVTDLNLFDVDYQKYETIQIEGLVSPSVLPVDPYKIKIIISDGVIKGSIRYKRIGTRLDLVGSFWFMISGDGSVEDITKQIIYSFKKYFAIGE